MGNVVVVTDSSATVPDRLVHELGIRVVPIVLNLAGQSYRDGVDLSPDEFYGLLRANVGTPTTSTPSIGEFVRVYTDAAHDAAGVVSIHVAQQLSSIHDTAVAASRLVANTPIRVVDSRSATMAHGFVVLEAARSAAAGADIETVAARAGEMASKVSFYAFLDTLEYLHRGGRIGGAAWLLGSALQIKPVIHLVDGQVEPFARPRTRRRATECILDAVTARVNGRPVHAAILHADAANEAERLRQRVSSQFDCAELYVAEFTPVMGAHTGPGLLGVAFYVDDESVE